MNRQDNSKIIDPFLLKVLEQHRGQSEFTDILRSIQSEQNNIVDYNFSKSIIVQGCAGSGKTMILFHRLANLLYSETTSVAFSTSRIAVIIPNDNFRAYIKNLTWSLGVNGITTYTMDEYLLAKVENVMNNIFKSEASDKIHQDERVRKNASIPILIQEIHSKMSEDFSNSEQISFDEQKVIELVDFIEDYQQTHRQMVDRRNAEQRMRLTYKKPGKDPEHEKWLKKSQKDIYNHRERAIRRLENEFFNGNFTREHLVNFLAVICTNDTLRAYRPTSDSLLMIDEGQDYSRLEYSALKSINPSCIFNIFGDTDQKIFERGIAKWGEIQELFNATSFELNQDYRNSNQIVDFVNERLGKNIQPIGFNAKDVEEVELSKLPVYLEYEGKLLKHNIAIVSEQPEKYQNPPSGIKLLTVKQIKGLEFDTIFISPEVLKENNNYQYVAFTRALSHLYLLK